MDNCENIHTHKCYFIKRNNYSFSLRKFFFSLEDNCFTMLCWFCCTTRQSAKVSICPLLGASLSALSSSQPSAHPSPLHGYRALGCTPCVRQQLPLAICCMLVKPLWFSAPFSIRPTRSSPGWPRVCFLFLQLYSCLQIFSISAIQIPYIYINIQY